jgi:hypothetical protein
VKVEFAFVAESAVRGADGKITAEGIFCDVDLFRVPGHLQSFAVVFRLRVDNNDLGAKHVLKVAVIDTEGNIQGGIALEFALLMAATPAKNGWAENFVTLTNVGFEKPGHYGVAIIVDDVSLWEIPLRVFSQGKDHI